MLFLVADKVEAALVALVTPVIYGPWIVTRKSSGDLAAPPGILCSAEEDGDEEPKGSGNFFINGSVAVYSTGVPNEDGSDKSPGLEPKLDDQVLVAAIFAAIRVSNLSDLLSAAVPDLTVFPGSVIFQATQRSRSTHAWIDTLNFRCLACGSSVAP